MGSEIIKMIGRDGNTKFPQSVEKAIFDENGERLDVKMKRLQNTVDAVGVGEPEKIEVTVRKSDYYRYINSGNENVQSGYFISDPIKINAGDIVSGSCSGTTRVSFVSRVTENGGFLKTIIAGVSETKDFVFIASEDMYIEFSGVNNSAKNIVKYSSNLVVDTPILGNEYNRKLYEAAGAVYNENTGLYELNGLVDITEEEMFNIYYYFNFNDIAMFYGGYPGNAAKSLKIRTNIPCMYTSPNYPTNAFSIKKKWSCLGAVMIYLEKIVITKTIEKNCWLIADNFIGCKYLFYTCPELRSIDGIIDISYLDGNIEYILRNCPKLESFSLVGVHGNISFIGSSSINKDSVLYMIQNSTATSAITITFESNVYEMAMADSEIQAALAEKTLVSLASA